MTYPPAVLIAGCAIARGEDPDISALPLPFPAALAPALAASGTERIEALRRNLGDEFCAEALRAAGDSAAEPWENPIPFELMDLPAWPAGVLPSTLEDYVQAVAEAIQVPAELPGMFVLGALAVACQRRVKIVLGPDWEEQLSLYLAVVLPPGERKSATVKEVADPLVQWETDEAKAAQPGIAEGQAEADILSKRFDAAKAIAAKAGAEEREDAERYARELARELDALKIPRSPRLLADDCTPERLATLLYEQGGRMGVIAPEPTVFEHMAGRYSKDGRSNLDVFLKGHAGDDLRVDRTTRSEFVKDPALTIAISPQPEAIQGRLLNREFRGRGAVGRFLFAMPTSCVGWRKTETAGIPAGVRAQYGALVRRLLDLPYGEDARVLRLAAESIPEWRAFLAATEVRLREDGELGDIRDWGCKLCGAVGRIARLLHMAEHAFAPEPWALPVSLATLQRAITIGEYFIAHARAVYGMMDADENRLKAIALLKIVGKWEKETVSKRDLFERLKGRKHFNEAGMLDAPLRLLEEHGFLRKREPPPARGRKSKVYDIHPTLRKPSQNSQNPSSDPLSANFANGSEVIW